MAASEDWRSGVQSIMQEVSSIAGTANVSVPAGYEDPPDVYLVVHTFNAAPAEDVTFEAEPARGWPCGVG